ncbi:MAG: monovalent cation/H(+) antiporter subunit G [Syntrophobacteria bacterium]
MKELLTFILTGGGSLFVLLASIGLLRMPDLYTRIHPSSKAATLGTVLILIGIAVHFEDGAIAVRAVLISLFLFLTAPVASHMIARAGFLSGVPLAEETSIDELSGRYDLETHCLSCPPAGAEEE